MVSNKVDIGFLEEKDNWLLHPKFFPSKVGGKPAWLDLKNLPQPEELCCKKCSDPLVFLCQVYAPYEERPDVFHRTIFIFVCRNGACCQINASDNFLVLRCQLSRQNDYFSYEPCKEVEDQDFLIDKLWPKFCDVCGSAAPSHCAKCKKTYYCSRKHQVLDWQRGHKEMCSQFQTDTYKPNNFTVTQAGKSLLFKEWELIVDEEDEDDPKDVDENQEMEKLRKLMQEKRAGTLSNVSNDELEQYTKGLPEDKVFNKFSKRINRHPDQVLRYDRGGQPLWITANTDNSAAKIPNCQYCGGERQFEFQIMPQLLNFIDVGIDLNSIDWGVLVVYTCKSSCNKGPVYKEEFLTKQDLSI